MSEQDLIDAIERDERNRDAALDMLEALLNVRNIISEAAMTGFNCHDGDWAERLFASQQVTSKAIANINAHLVAAAPDMLAALRAYVGDEPELAASFTEPSAPFRLARAAIAKAEGKS